MSAVPDPISTLARRMISHVAAQPHANSNAELCRPQGHGLARRTGSGAPSESRSSDGLPAGTVLRVHLDARDDRWLPRLTRSIKRKSGATEADACPSLRRAETSAKSTLNKTI